MRKRIDKLRQKFDGDKAVLITGKPNIFYFSGFTSDDAYLLITPDSAYIYTDGRYTIQAKQQAADFEIVNAEDGLKKLLEKTDCKTIIIEDDYMTLTQLNKLREAAADKHYLGGSSAIAQLRAVKSHEEIKKINEAERLGDEAFLHILQFIKPGKSEREIALELEFFMKKNGASALSFETISASGVRSAMPHGAASDKKLCEGDLFTLDFGCVLDGYCSDMTRTVGIVRLDDKSREIYDTVLRAQKAAISAIKSGMSCFDADKTARDIISEAGYGQYFTHSLGHSVGIEIHELPSLSPKSKDILQTGNVVTVEPGIYIPDFGGVRIEDVVAVTETGCVNLTGAEKELRII